MSATCQTVINALEELAPVHLAESWDNVGLLIGSPSLELSGIVIALDVDLDVLEFAVKHKANLIIVHHPVIFKGITSLREDNPQGELLCRLVQQKIAVIAAHTNLDAAWGGVNDALATVIGLNQVTPLTQTYSEKLYKLAVFVPASHLASVRAAMGGAGAGHIGVYSHCSFSAKGEGAFLPLAGAKPFIGSQGELELVDEYKFETIVTEHTRHQVIKAMLSTHPYEEVAYDLYALANELPVVGMGRVGQLDRAITLRQFIARVGGSLRANSLKAVGDPETIVQTVALCGGSGAGLLFQAKQAGADVYLTGDVKYHEAQQASALGLSLVDAGHFATEFPVVDCLKNYLSSCSRAQKWDIPLYSAPGKDIFWS